MNEKNKILRGAIFLVLVVVTALFAGCFDEAGNRDGDSASESLFESATENISENISESGNKTSESENFESESEEETYTVSFDTDGGTYIADVTAKKGEKIAKPNDPEKATLQKQYTFLYWEYRGEKWDFEKDVVTGNICLTAKWRLDGDYTVGF